MKPAAANPYTAAELVADRPWLLGLGTRSMGRRMTLRTHLATILRTLSRPRGVRTVCSECRCVHRKDKP